MTPKAIIFSAPSGSGKSTVIGRVTALDEMPPTGFSVSATSRPPRGAEKQGVEYHFMSPERFKHLIDEGAFVEYEEVYPGRYYGTLRSEIDRILDSGRHCILDLDVKGAMSVKKLLGDRAVTIFIQPPSVEELRRRLENRGTDSAEDIEKRVARAEFELGFAPKFDHVVVNDDLEHAVRCTADIIRSL